MAQGLVLIGSLTGIEQPSSGELRQQRGIECIDRIGVRRGHLKRFSEIGMKVVVAFGRKGTIEALGTTGLGG